VKKGYNLHESPVSAGSQAIAALVLRDRPRGLRLLQVTVAGLYRALPGRSVPPAISRSASVVARPATGGTRVIKTAVKQAILDVGSRAPQRLIDSLNNLTSYLELGQQIRRRHFGRPSHYPTREALFDSTMTRLRSQRLLYLEFGVFEGETIRRWTRGVAHPEARFHGFDSFEGLPATWNAAYPKGLFSTGGVPPTIDDPRVEFFNGWFSDTLPGYTAPEHDVLFVDMDADLYSSTVTVLNHIEDLLTVGSYIYFDEYNDRCHELRAFDEFLERTGMQFRAIAVVDNMWQWLFQRVG
jgi:hypothetical protein